MGGWGADFGDLGRYFRGKDWKSAPWLFAEALHYRRLHECFSISKHWKTYDVFFRQSAFFFFSSPICLTRLLIDVVSALSHLLFHAPLANLLPLPTTTLVPYHPFHSDRVRNLLPLGRRRLRALDALRGTLRPRPQARRRRTLQGEEASLPRAHAGVPLGKLDGLVASDQRTSLPLLPLAAPVPVPCAPPAPYFSLSSTTRDPNFSLLASR